MSQSRKFKTPQAERAVPNGDNAPRNRPSVARTVEDLQSRAVHPKERRKSKSKNKIPKSVRYDLESALVGLCDVWFEEIKPHLVRNNIKLHVHNPKGGADANCASGDFEQARSDTPPCAHLDPGAAPDLPRQKNAFYVESCAMQPTALEAHYFKPQMSIPHQYETSTPNQPSPHRQTQNCRQSSEILCSKKCKLQSRRVSRMCQTYIIPAAIPEPVLPIKNISIRNLFKSIFNKVPICPVSSPVAGFPKSREQIVSRSVALKNAQTYCRPQVTASLSNNITQQKKWRDPPVLFPNDLIDIIGKRNDTILRNIRESHEKVGYPSLVDLVSPKDRKKAVYSKKNPPWR